VLKTKCHFVVKMQFKFDLIAVLSLMQIKFVSKVNTVRHAEVI